MINSFILLALCFGYTTSAGISRRVVGGHESSIQKYPSTASVHKTDNENVVNSAICGGVVLDDRHVLTAAHCFNAITTLYVNPRNYKVRVGSALAHSGGTLHRVNMIAFHPRWSRRTYDNDLAIMRTQANIRFIPDVVIAASIASSTYRLRDNESLWAVGWGITENGHESEQIRDVELLVVNQGLCKGLYKHLRVITDNILCSGWPYGGGRDLCTRDSGSPLYHEGVVVAIGSQGRGCGEAEFPSVNVRVSGYADWIQERSDTKNLVDRYLPNSYFLPVHKTTEKSIDEDVPDENEPKYTADEPSPKILPSPVERGLDAAALYREALLRQSPYFPSRTAY